MGNMARYSFSPEIAVMIATGEKVVPVAFMTSDDRKLVSRIERQLSINGDIHAAIHMARNNIEMFSSDFVVTRK